MQTKGNVTVTEAGMDADRKGTHTIRIINDITGEVEIEMTGAEGGMVIAQHKDESLMGTDQFAFGSSAAVVTCALKAKIIIKQMVKQDPRLGQLIERGSKLAKDCGIDTTI